MANVDTIDANGLQLKSFDVLLEEFQTRMREIYGQDINLDQDSPDGQLTNIVAQMGTDIREVLQRIYDVLNIDNATGVNLDRACALIGITRKGGTRTVTPITITTSAACTLVGLNQSETDAYTVQDNAGNKWNLQNTKYFSGPDAASLSFQAETIGHQLTTPNTITTPVTLVLGVASINNPTVATIIGEDEETDLELRTRAKRSIMLASVGFSDSLYAALMNLDGMASVKILENVTNVVDENGTSPHSIHVITAGSATSKDIATTIMQKRSAGCGMDGDIVYPVMNADGYPIDIKWSVVTIRYLFAYADIYSLDGINLPQYDLIRNTLPTALTPAVGEVVTTNQLITAINSIDNNAYVTDANFSFGQTQKFQLYEIQYDDETEETSALTTNKIKIKYNGNTSEEIDLNGTSGEITSAVHAVAGLEDVAVSYASGSLVFIFDTIDEVLGPIEIAEINAVDDGTYYYLKGIPQDTFKKTPSMGIQYQLALDTNRTFLTPLAISPTPEEITVGQDVQFTAMGGDGDYHWFALDSTGAAYTGFALEDDGHFNTTGLFEPDTYTANTIEITCFDGMGNRSSIKVTLQNS